MFAHMEYDFSSRSASAFEVFRFEDGRAVEHWDNIQPLLGPNPSGHGMLDGATEITDLDRTEENRTLARSFVENVLIQRQFDQIGAFVAKDVIQHSPEIADGLSPWRAALEATTNGAPRIRYDKLHRVLAEGSFVLCMSEGERDGAHTSFYDLRRSQTRMRPPQPPAASVLPD